MRALGRCLGHEVFVTQAWRSGLRQDMVPSMHVKRQAWRPILIIPVLVRWRYRNSWSSLTNQFSLICKPGVPVRDLALKKHMNGSWETLWSLHEHTIMHLNIHGHIHTWLRTHTWPCTHRTTHTLYPYPEVTISFIAEEFVSMIHRPILTI